MKENRKEHTEDINRPNENDRRSDEIDENGLPVVESPEKFEKNNDGVKQKLNFLVLMTFNMSIQKRGVKVSLWQLKKEGLISDDAYNNAIQELEDGKTKIKICNKDGVESFIDLESSNLGKKL